MTTLRIHEGELTIDHRGSPGLPIHDPAWQTIVQRARAEGKALFCVGEGVLFESATITCVHCNAVVVLNPDRSRPRGYCRRCDQYICDGCAAVAAMGDGTCRPFEQFLVEEQNRRYHQHLDEGERNG